MTIRMSQAQEQLSRYQNHLRYHQTMGWHYPDNRISEEGFLPELADQTVELGSRFQYWSGEWDRPPIGMYGPAVPMIYTAIIVTDEQYAIELAEQNVKLESIAAEKASVKASKKAEWQALKSWYQSKYGKDVPCLNNSRRGALLNEYRQEVA